MKFPKWTAIVLATLAGLYVGAFAALVWWSQPDYFAGDLALRPGR